MSDENNNFLSYLLNEELYLIEEKEVVQEQTEESESETTQEQDVEDVVEKQQKVEEPTVTEEPTVVAEVRESKEILIVFEYADEMSLPADLAEYLEKILGAINKSMDEVRVINFREADHDLSGYQYAICFTKLFKAASVGEAYVPQVKDGITWIPAHTLSTIKASTNLRKDLWQALQKVFLS